MRDGSDRPVMGFMRDRPDMSGQVAMLTGGGRNRGRAAALAPGDDGGTFTNAAPRGS